MSSFTVSIGTLPASFFSREATRVSFSWSFFSRSVLLAVRSETCVSRAETDSAFGVSSFMILSFSSSCAFSSSIVGSSMLSPSFDDAMILKGEMI